MFHVLPGCVYCRHSLKRMAELIHLRVQQRQFKHVLAQKESNTIQLTYFGKSLKKSVARSELHVEIKSKENPFLHVKNLFSCAVIVTDENKIFQQRWIYFFILCSYQHCCNSNKLNFSFANLDFRKETIYNIHG